MKKYINNKYLRWATIAAGVAALMFVIYFMRSITYLAELLENESSYLQLFYSFEEFYKASLVGRTNTLINLYYIMTLLCAVLVGAAVFIKFKEKKEDVTTMPLLIGNGISFVLLIMNWGQMGVIKRVINNMELTASDLHIGDPIKYFKNFGTFLVLALLSQMLVAVMAFSFEWLMKKGVLKVAAVQPMNIPASMPNMPGQTKTMPKIPNIPNVPEKSFKEKVVDLKENAASYVKTPKGKKTLRIGGIALAAIFALFGGSKIYEEMNKPVIDLTEKCELVVEGYEESGTAYASCPVEVDGKGLTKEQKNALLSVKFETEAEQGELKNGDTVHVKAVYDKDVIDTLGLKIENPEKDVKVDKLSTVYTKYASISEEDQKKMDDSAYNLVQSTFKKQNDDYTRVTEEGHERVAKYFRQNGATSQVVYIYRIDYVYEDRIMKTSEFSDAEKRHTYYTVTFKNLSPEEELVADTTSNDIEVNDIYSATSNNNAIKTVKGSLEEDTQFDVEVLLENKSDDTYN